MSNFVGQPQGDDDVAIVKDELMIKDEPVSADEEAAQDEKVDLEEASSHFLIAKEPSISNSNTDASLQRRKKHVNSLQKQLLLKSMEDNPDLYSGRGRAIKTKWEELGHQLNMISNGALKSTEDWQRTWVQLKHKVKAKTNRIKAHMRQGGGGGSPSRETLSYFESRIVALMGVEITDGLEGAYGSGVPSDEPQAVYNGHVEEPVNNIFDEGTYLDPTTSVASASPPQPLPSSSPPDTAEDVCGQRKRKRAVTNEDLIEVLNRQTLIFERIAQSLETLVTTIASRTTNFSQN
uniref:Uncharacterized protein n=1 Tax=Lygus hesperus TaxID=30085 RepID=A0A146M617_LYGHE